MSEQQRLVKPMFKLPEGAPAYMPPRKSPEEKKYYLLIAFKNEDRDPTWQECTGRAEAYDEAKRFVLDNADVEMSRVFVEGVIIGEEVNLFWFLSKMKEVYQDASFDVTDYMEGDPQEAVDLSTADMEEIPQQVNSFYDEPDNGDRDI